MNTNSRIPMAAKASRAQSMRRRPPISAKHLGVSSVSGMSRRPRPAPMMIPFTQQLPPDTRSSESVTTMDAASHSSSRQASEPPSSQTYVIGDVHGEYETLVALVERLPLRPEDVVIQLG